MYCLHIERNITRKLEVPLEFNRTLDIGLPPATGWPALLDSCCVMIKPQLPSLLFFLSVSHWLLPFIPSTPFCWGFGTQHLQGRGSSLFINPPSSRKLLLGGVFVSENLMYFSSASRPAVFTSNAYPLSNSHDQTNGIGANGMWLSTMLEHHTHLQVPTSLWLLLGLLFFKRWSSA